MDPTPTGPNAAWTNHPLITDLTLRLRALVGGALNGRQPMPADAVQLLHAVGRHIGEARMSDEARAGVLLHPVLEHAIERLMQGGATHA